MWGTYRPSRPLARWSSSRRARELADCLEQAACELTRLAAALTDAQWLIRIPNDGRTIGVLVHHVASVYPLEVQVAQMVAAGLPVTMMLNDINALNATHAKMFGSVTRETTLHLLRRNSAAAAIAVRAMSDAQLDRVACESSRDGTPLTCQFVLEEHAVRHSYRQLARIQAALRVHDDLLERLKDGLEHRQGLRRLILKCYP